MKRLARLPALHVLLLMVLMVALAGTARAQELEQTRVFVEPFENQTDTAAVDTLGAVLVAEIRLTIALLDGFLLVGDASGADIRITSTMDVREGGVYRSVSAVVEDGAAVAVVEQEFPSVFDVFDAGGEAGEELLSTYTDRVLEFARLVIAPSRRTEGLEISIDGQTLDTNSLQLDRVLTGARRIEARFTGQDRPFFSRELVLTAGADVRLPVSVPALGPQAHRQALAEELARQFASAPAASVPAEQLRSQRERFSGILAARRVRRVAQLPGAAFAARLEGYGATASRFQLPWLREGVITVDGRSDDWASVPIHNQSNNDVSGPDVLHSRFAHDQERFYGLLHVEDFDPGDGLEVSIVVNDGPGTGSEAARINIPMARTNAETGVLLKVFAETGGDWSTRYETRTTAVYREGVFEFSLPARALRAPGVERNAAGIPRRITVDFESGVSLSGSDFDYQLYDFSGRRTLNAVMRNAEP